MKNTLKIVVSLILAFALTALAIILADSAKNRKSSPIKESMIDAKSIPFETIIQDQQKGPKTEEDRFELWTRADDVIPDLYNENNAKEKFNFGKNVYFAASTYGPNSCYSIEIERIELFGDMLTVHVDKTGVPDVPASCAQIIVYPVHVVSVKRTTLPQTFELEFVVDGKSTGSAHIKL